jgi:hypothetical protein
VRSFTTFQAATSWCSHHASGECGFRSPTPWSRKLPVFRSYVFHPLPVAGDYMVEQIDTIRRDGQIHDTVAEYLNRRTDGTAV